NYALKNICDVIRDHSYDDGEIICILDGDDRFSHPYVLNVLNHCYTLYRNSVTYGSFTEFSSLDLCGVAYNEDEFMNVRVAPWKATHLKTVQVAIFKELLELDPSLENMKDECGNFLEMPYDIAIMIPLLELSGFGNSVFIDS